MTRSGTNERVRGGRLSMPRSRGAASGFLLILLGVWGAAVPFLGPDFDFGFSQGQSWSPGRWWLEVLPGLVTIAGGVLLFLSRNRVTAMLGGWLTVVAGAWFVVGRAFAGPLGLGDVGSPVADTDTKRVWLELSYFYGLGALIVFLGALALGRLSVRTVRDVEYAQRPTPVVEERTADADVRGDEVRGDVVRGREAHGHEVRGDEVRGDVEDARDSRSAPVADARTDVHPHAATTAPNATAAATPRRRGFRNPFRRDRDQDLSPR